jgi:hypothetical protein
MSWLATPRSLINRLACVADGHHPERWGRGSHWSRWTLSQGLHYGSHPIVDRIILASCWAVSGRWGTVPTVTALGGVVLSKLHGTRVVFDQTKVTTVPSVLAGSVQHAYSCQSEHVSLGLRSPRSPQGSGWWRGHESFVRRAAKVEGGVTADPGLGVRPKLLSLAGPQSFRPLLTDVSWAARPAN